MGQNTSSKKLNFTEDVLLKSEPLQPILYKSMNSTFSSAVKDLTLLFFYVPILIQSYKKKKTTLR